MDGSINFSLFSRLDNYDASLLWGVLTVASWVPFTDAAAFRSYVFFVTLVMLIIKAWFTFVKA